MALFKKTALGSAILTAIAASSASAATGNSGPMMGGLFNNSFFSDSKMTLQLKNYYRKTTDKNDGSSTVTNKAWAQAAHLDFKSGWFMNWVGLDLSGYTSLKLSGSKGKSNVGLLAVDSDGESHSFSQGGYALKVNLMDQGVLKYGRMLVDSPLLRSNTEYTLPVLYQGFYGDISWEGLTGYAGYFNEVSNFDNSGFDKLGANNSSGTFKKQAVMMYGASYQIEQLKLRATQTRQNDFARYSYADATYMMPTGDMGKFTFGAQAGRVNAIGAMKDTADSNSQDDALGWWGAMLNWNLDKMSAGLSHVRIGSSDGMTTNKNVWSSARSVVNTAGGDIASGERFIGYTAGLVYDFALPGTRSTRVDLGYDLSDYIKGLSASAGYTFGKIKYSDGVDDHKVSEFDIGVSYQIPYVKGLSADLQYGSAKDRYKSSGENKTNKDSDTRVILNYEIAVF